MPLPKAITAFWVTAILTFCLSLVVAAWGHHAHSPPTRWDPLSDPLLGDLMEYPGTYCLLHTTGFFQKSSASVLPERMLSAVAYPPFAAAVLAPVYRLGSPVWNFLCLAAVGLILAIRLTSRALHRAGLSTACATLLPLSLVLLSFPVERLIHQGNIELLVWAFTATGVWASMRNRNQTAAGLWALAGAMKLYPLVLLLLLLPRRCYRAIFLGAGVFVGVSWLSLWWLGPTVAEAWRGSLRNVFGYQNLRASEWSLRELVANHSIFWLVKLGALIAHIPSSRLTLPYYICGAALMVWAFIARLRHMAVANQLLAITAFMLLLPQVSYFHTLVHLYAPLLLLGFTALRAQRTGTEVRGLGGTMLLGAFLLSPYTLLTFPHAFLFCGLLQSLALVILFLCALEFPFP